MDLVGIELATFRKGVDRFKRVRTRFNTFEHRGTGTESSGYLRGRPHEGKFEHVSTRLKTFEYVSQVAVFGDRYRIAWVYEGSAARKQVPVLGA